MANRAYAYVRCVIRGTIATSQTWSTSFATTAPADSLTASQLTLFSTDVLASVNNWFAVAAVFPNHNAADTLLTGVTSYYYLANTPSANLVATKEQTTPLAGNSTQYGSVRDALVVSLKTGLSGRSFSGRMYFPITAAPFSANHQLGQSQCNSWATATGNLFNSVNASGYGTWTPQVIVANDKDFPPFVTQVKVDSNPDTQRRREDKLRAAFFKLQDVLV